MFIRRALNNVQFCLAVFSEAASYFSSPANIMAALRLGAQSPSVQLREAQAERQEDQEEDEIETNRSPSPDPVSEEEEEVDSQEESEEDDESVRIENSYMNHEAPAKSFLQAPRYPRTFFEEKSIHQALELEEEELEKTGNFSYLLDRAELETNRSPTPPRRAEKNYFTPIKFTNRHP